MRSVVSADSINRLGFVVHDRERNLKKDNSVRGHRAAFQRVHFANLKDDVILSKSLSYAEKKSKSSMSGRLSDSIMSISTLLVPLAYGVMKKGNVVKDEAGNIVKNNVLSSKVGAIVPAVLIFTAASFLIDKYNNIINRAENASSDFAIKRVAKPAVTAVVDTLAKAAMLGTAAFSFTKGKNVLKNNFAPAAKFVSSSVEKAAEKMDATKLSEKLADVSDKFTVFASKHPGMSALGSNKYLKALAPAAAWLGLSGILDKKVLDDKNKMTGKNAGLLFIAREFAQEA